MTVQAEFAATYEFEWDAGNVNKNRSKHNVTGKEAEEIFFNRPLLIFGDDKHSSKEQRFLAYGQTNEGRKLSVVFTRRTSHLRIISARDQSRKERRIYEENSKKDSTV